MTRPNTIDIIIIHQMKIILDNNQLPLPTDMFTAYIHFKAIQTKRFHSL